MKFLKKLLMKKSVTTEVGVEEKPTVQELVDEYLMPYLDEVFHTEIDIACGIDEDTVYMKVRDNISFEDDVIFDVKPLSYYKKHGLEATQQMVEDMVVLALGRQRYLKNLED